jgi:Eco57I restriction-modification methylase
MTARANALTGLVGDLRRQVLALEEDLRARSEEVAEFSAALTTEYRQARAADRTAATYEAWRDGRVTQVAAAWVLSTVFVRYCEDNRLIEWPFIAGPGDRLADAEERHEAHFREHPRHNDRDWLVAAFDHLSEANPTAAGLFDRGHNPLWEIEPSFEAASALLAFWRRKNDDGDIRYDFEGVDTRFLGDLYQDLSEYARKTYALLQTPEFVEEFILDLTLKPALEEFGLAGLRTIDPACGSGHFLLGIFRRLLARWRGIEPGTDDWDLIRRSLESVHGCDKNPFAASIARFRLLVAALDAAGEKRLDKAPSFPINVAVGDSLMHGEGVKNEQYDLLASPEVHTYRTEDVTEFIRSCDLLKTGSYHVVVGNPPYITVKDKQENESYRERYSACAGTYALSVPFAQRLFQLAIRRDGSDRDAGFVGQITANSFMKREFGKKLIEKFFPTVHLTHVIDTSGAYIPGHGTPTVILVGRNHISRPNDPIRAILGVRGEPSQPDDPSQGLVWRAILDQVGKPGSRHEWVSAVDVERESFYAYPWSLSGGGSANVVNRLEVESSELRSRGASIGYTGQTNADDAFLFPSRSLWRHRIDVAVRRPFLTGVEVRDYQADSVVSAIFPYVERVPLEDLATFPSLLRLMWSSRTSLWSRATFDGSTYLLAGRSWWIWHQVAKSRLDGPVITWPLVQTHQHFVYLRECTKEFASF